MLKKLREIIAAPTYVLNYPSLNRLGLQRLRIKCKKVESLKNVHFQREDFFKAYEALSLNGVAVINNFLSSIEFEKLESDIESLSSSGMLKKEIGKEGGVIEWEHGNFPNGYSPVVEEKIRKNKDILNLVKGYTRRPLISLPEVIFQALKLPLGCVDNEDIQTVLHADRHYRTIKIFFTITDHTKENGAFWYCSGSHEMTAERMNYEVEYSIRSSLERTGQHEKLLESDLEKGRSIINQDLVRKYELLQIMAPKNSLIIADVSGFHKRGLIKEGETRKTVRLIYHYVHAPVWAQFILKLFKKQPGRYLN
jgi:hypothetical protein